METIGQPFDPEVMDAIMREPTDEAEDGTVLSEYRKGFKVSEWLNIEQKKKPDKHVYATYISGSASPHQIGDQLLRPAMVQVAVALEESAPDKVETAEETKS